MIELENYSVRFLEAADAQALFELIDSNRPRLVRYLPITAKDNGALELTRAYISERSMDVKNRTVFTCLIEDKANSELAGMIIIKKLDWHAGSCELGYFICQNYEGQGITSLVVEATCRHCFEKLRLNSIDIVTGPDNLASIRVAEKSGFEKREVMIGGHKDDQGNAIDVFRFRLSRDKK